MARILVTHWIPESGLAPLAGHEILIPEQKDIRFSDDMQRTLIEDCEAVIAGGELRGDVIRRGKKLRIIANYGAGYNRVDIAAAAKMGIPVTNIPDEVCDSTAELAIGLMLAVSRRIAEMNSRLHTLKPEEQFGMGLMMGHTLRGKRLGIVGMGHIGRRTAEIARALGMEVEGLRREGRSREALRAPLRELLQRCDVISLHCPLTAETENLMDREMLTAAKAGCILINTARGGVVDHDALCDLLDSGHIAGAGLDVFPAEPHVPQRLTGMPNVVLTPHIGTNTYETRDDMARANSRQILDVFAGKRPEHIVNGL